MLTSINRFDVILHSNHHLLEMLEKKIMNKIIKHCKTGIYIYILLLHYLKARDNSSLKEILVV